MSLMYLSTTCLIVTDFNLLRYDNKSMELEIKRYNWMKILRYKKTYFNCTRNLAFLHKIDGLI